MIQLLQQNRDALARLCRKYGVAKLELFGSAATGDFKPISSDLDFLVEFQSDSASNPFRQYFDFLAELKKLFGHSIDLVEVGAMKNPYFIRSVNKQKVLLYAA